MDLTAVLSVLRDAGYPAVSLSAIQEGSNHYVFDVTLENGKHAICKFAKVRKTELGLTAANLVMIKLRLPVFIQSDLLV